MYGACPTFTQIFVRVPERTEKADEKMALVYKHLRARELIYFDLPLPQSDGTYEFQVHRIDKVSEVMETLDQHFGLALELVAEVFLHQVEVIAYTPKVGGGVAFKDAKHLCPSCRFGLPLPEYAGKNCPNCKAVQVKRGLNRRVSETEEVFVLTPVRVDARGFFVCAAEAIQKAFDEDRILPNAIFVANESLAAHRRILRFTLNIGIDYSLPINVRPDLFYREKDADLLFALDRSHGHLE